MEVEKILNVNDHVKVIGRNLPRLAAKYAGQEGQVVKIKDHLGSPFYKVRFSDVGEALYTNDEIKEVVE